MWKCPDCETLNNDEFCVVCGKKRPDNAQVPQSQEEPKSTKYIKKETKKTNIWLIVAIVLFAVIIAMAAIIIVISGEDENENKESEREVAVVTQEVGVVPTEEPQVLPTAAPVETHAPVTTPSVAPESGVTADENEIKRIQNRYYYVQDILSDCRVVTDGSDVKYYYDSSDELVRVDVQPEAGFGYSRNYYYDDGELYFAFVFIGNRVENRFYFSDGKLIRWINNSKQKIDNAYADPQYMEWENLIQSDAARFAY